MITLPRELDEAIATRLRTADPRRVARVAEALSRRYRGERRDGERLVQQADDALAYAGWLLPATFAQIRGALAMVPRRAGSWSPRTLLDLGAGPGTAVWAVAATWPGLESAVCVEREAAFVSLGRDLAAASAHAAIRAAAWRTGDLRDLELAVERFDLVVVAHVAGEMASGDAGMAVRQAWQACDGVLVVVEPGTPAGFARVESLRRALVAQGAHVLAPCPHAGRCPLEGLAQAEPPDWCHFSERVQRPQFQRRLKGAELSWEDARFAFVAAARRAPAEIPWARVLRHPIHGKGHVELELCAREGRLRRVVGRSAGEGWKRARKLEWGDALQAPSELGGATG